MTSHSQLEDLLSDSLKSEACRLVPDAVPDAAPPPIVVRHADPRPDPAADDSARSIGSAPARRWRIPLVAAVAVAAISIVVVTLVSIRTSRTAANTSAPATSRFGEVIGVMPAEQLRRADLIINAFAASGTTSATPSFGFDNLHLDGYSTSVMAYSILGERTLSVTFIGTTDGKDINCGYDYSLSAVVSDRVVAIYLSGDPGTWPGGPDVACAYTDKLRQVQITLPRPLAGQTVVDTLTGQPVPQQ